MKFHRTRELMSNKANSMDFERYRDDQLNTGVIAALVGGFSLANSWEMESSGSLIATSTYVLAIVAVHACTCSALTSAFLYRSLTMSDADEAVRWMEGHPGLATMPFMKFVIGTLAYLASVILVALQELAEDKIAKQFTFVVGIMGFCVSIGTLCYLCYDSPAHCSQRKIEQENTTSTKNIEESAE